MARCVRFLRGVHSNAPVMRVNSGMYFFALVFLLASWWLLPISAYTPPSSNRTDILLDTNWKFIKSDVSGAQTVLFSDAAWALLNLPHTWNNLDGQDGGNNYYRGVGWYRKHFTVSSALAGRSLFLRFEGSNQVADVYLNGTLLGQHKGGFSAFCYNITSLVTVGTDNVLAVKVSNASSNDIPPISADFTFFGGIYRSVHLLATDNLAITPLDYASSGVYIKPTAVSTSSAGLTITAKIRNGNTAAKTAAVTAVVVDATGTTVATLTGSQTIAAGQQSSIVLTGTIANPHLWNGLADPYCYTVYVQVSDGTTTTDVVTQPLGLRSFSVDAANGFFLNGSYLDLHGVNRHQDRLNMGWAITNKEHLEDFNLIREIGATTIRLSHYQHAEYFYKLCDSIGMVVWAEIPLVNKVTVSDSFYVNSKQQLTELIRQNYNHPSIFFWGIGNEIASSPDPNPLLDTLNKLMHREDSTRLSTYASNTKTDTNTTNAINWHTDITGFNQYFGWYADNGPLSSFQTWPAKMRSRYPAARLGFSEYGAGGAISQHAENPPAPDPYGRPHPEEYQNLFHEAAWQAMKTKPYLWCKFIWAMFDFAVDSRNEGETAGRNDKGLVTYDRKTKKDAFFWYKANWTTAPLVYISSRRYTPRLVDTVEVKVYSNTDSVKLFVNGIAKTTIPSDLTRIFKWKQQKLAQGNNLIKVIGYQSGVAYADSCIWLFGTSAIKPAAHTLASIPQAYSVRVSQAPRALVISCPAENNQRLQLFTSSGKLLSEQNGTQQTSYTVALPSLSKGVFLLRITDAGRTFVQKVVVQK